jgi:hypothetical protein
MNGAALETSTAPHMHRPVSGVESSLMMDLISALPGSKQWDASSSLETLHPHACRI